MFLMLNQSWEPLMEDVWEGDPNKSERMGVKGRLYLLVFVLHFTDIAFIVQNKPHTTVM